jgi:hypothetical protein
MSIYYDTKIFDTVRGPGNKLYHISVRNHVPYVTYKRKTRVLYQNKVAGAFINIGCNRVYFR